MNISCNAIASFARFDQIPLRLLRVTICLLLSVVTPTWAQRSPDLIAGEQAYRQGDVRAAIAKLRPLADAGNAVAQALLGEILDRAERDDEAITYFRKSAEQGNADGAYGLASMLSVGEGGTKDPVAARSWFEKAAVAGHEGAVKGLASAYIGGGLDLTTEARQSPDALRWIKLAVDLNFVPALDRMAKANRLGEFGLPVDVKAAELLEAKSRTLRGVAPAKGKKNVAKPN